MSDVALRLVRHCLVSISLLVSAAAFAAGAAESDPPALLSAVVKVRTKALADARTAPYLGTTREGTGIVIDDKGHILTIGYIVIEADAVEVTTAGGRTVPALLVGYDHASGFGLLRATEALGARPVELGDSSQLAERDPVMVLPHGGRDQAMLAFVASRRPFAGSWEYLIDSAIFTAPPTGNWAGSALIDREGRLVGVGSLLVRFVLSDDTPAAGNMFVPIDLVKPILADLIAQGRTRAPPRPWLGVATEELKGHLVVSRVSPDGPGDLAGVAEGDIVVGVGGEPVTEQADFYRKLWRLGSAGVEVPLKVLKGAEVKELRLNSIDRLEYFRAKPVY